MKKTNILDADGFSPHIDKARKENIKADVVQIQSLGVREYIPQEERVALLKHLSSGKPMPTKYFIDKPKPYHGSPGHGFKEFPQEFITALEMVIEEDNVDQPSLPNEVAPRQNKFLGLLVRGAGQALKKFIKPNKKASKKTGMEKSTLEAKTLKERQTKLKEMEKQYSKDFENLSPEERVLMEDKIEILRHSIQRTPKQEGGMLDQQMENIMGTEAIPEEEVMPEEELIPDEQMEQNFVDFVVDEALTDEEESILEEQLEANPELSLIFDKVLEKASEFTGAGLVNGPGTGTSDDIPARLSDGEFVFTAKAVEEIGVDNLTSMMKEAEVRADNRQGMANGGTMYKKEEKQMSSPIYGAKVQQEPAISNEIKEGMVGNNPLDPRHRYYQ